MNGPCHHGTPGGCRYCRAIEIADEGPDPEYVPCHTGPAAHACGGCYAALVAAANAEE